MIKPTHVLIKQFNVQRGEVYKLGTLVKVLKGRKGFGHNVVFLTKKGRIKKVPLTSIQGGALSIFDKDNFIPMNKWFIILKEKK